MESNECSFITQEVALSWKRASITSMRQRDEVKTKVKMSQWGGIFPSFVVPSRTEMSDPDSKRGPVTLIYPASSFSKVNENTLLSTHSRRYKRATFNLLKAERH